jgi:hypothetical protein
MNLAGYILLVSADKFPPARLNNGALGYIAASGFSGFGAQGKPAFRPF